MRLIEDIDVYSLLQGKRVILDIQAVQFLEDWLGREDFISEERQLGGPLHATQSCQDGDNPDDGLEKQDATIEKEGAPMQVQRHDVNSPIGRSGGGAAGHDINNPDGGIKESDVVIEQEEAPVKEQRHEDPLDDGDKIRKHMEDLAKQQKEKTTAEDSPSIKDIL